MHLQTKYQKPSNGSMQVSALEESFIPHTISQRVMLPTNCLRVIVKGLFLPFNPWRGHKEQGCWNAISFRVASGILFFAIWCNFFFFDCSIISNFIAFGLILCKPLLMCSPGSCTALRIRTLQFYELVWMANGYKLQWVKIMIAQNQD